MRPPGPAPRRGAGFDHSRFARALAAATDDGWRIDYGAVARSSDLAAYRRDLAAADPSALAPDERLAFWINAHNASAARAGGRAHAGAQRARDRRRLHPGAVPDRPDRAHGRRDRRTASSAGSATRAPTSASTTPRSAARPCAPTWARTSPGSWRRTGSATSRTSSGARGATATGCCSAGCCAGSPATSPRSGRCPRPSAPPWARCDRRASYRRSATCCPSALRDARGAGFLDYDWAVNGG